MQAYTYTIVLLDGEGGHQGHLRVESAGDLHQELYRFLESWDMHLRRDRAILPEGVAVSGFLADSVHARLFDLYSNDLIQMGECALIRSRAQQADL